MKFRIWSVLGIVQPIFTFYYTLAEGIIILVGNVSDNVYIFLIRITRRVDQAISVCPSGSVDLAMSVCLKVVVAMSVCPSVLIPFETSV